MDREPGLYEDRSNGDLWAFSEDRTWRWLNGHGWVFVPEGLVRVGDSLEKIDLPSIL